MKEYLTDLRYTKKLLVHHNPNLAMLWSNMYKNGIIYNIWWDIMPNLNYMNFK